MSLLCNITYFKEIFPGTTRVGEDRREWEEKTEEKRKSKEKETRYKNQQTQEAKRKKHGK